MRGFSEALERGHEAENVWVSAQQSLGLAVANGKKFREFGVDRHQAPDAAIAARVEIKERNLRFTSPEDYPFQTAFLNNVANSYLDVTQPLIYVLISSHTGAWVWVAATDQNDEWTTAYQRDTTRGCNVLTLQCPRSYLRPADTLKNFILSHDILDLIDGRADAFRASKEATGGDRETQDGER